LTLKEAGDARKKKNGMRTNDEEEDQKFESEREGTKGKSPSS